MRCGVLFIVCVLLVSCATMKNGSTRPTEGTCMNGYDSAKIGEKESAAGSLLLPAGVAFTVGGSLTLAISTIPIARKGADPIMLQTVGGIMTGLGVASFIAGLVTLIDGHQRVNNWNKYCVGATAAERYCLFEPLPVTSGETP